MLPFHASPHLRDLAARFAPEPPEDLIREAPTSTDLPTLKSRWFLSWAAQSLSGAPFARLADWQTRFAEATVARALDLAWSEHSKSLRIDAPLRGLFVLGLGKLGGRDLNVSSDVDLVAFHEPDTFPVPAHRGQAYEADRLLKRFNLLLQPRHSSRFVWRTDWRLRPEASTRGLAMETESALDFYSFRALPWHRLALLKARVVAGDRDAGERFLRALEPFIWRRNLDLRALDELAGIKLRINAEHPGLRAERAAPEAITDDPAGFNVKLGTGGIREIEFIANSQQLVWGGKQPDLRTPNTLEALAALAEHGHIPASEAAELAAIYKRLRRLENAIQMRGDEHTHIVPDGEALEDVKTLLGAGDGFASRLRSDRETVDRHFRSVFADDIPAASVSPPRWVASLPEPAAAIVRDWEEGFRRLRLKPGAVPGLANELLWRITASGTDPSEAVTRVDRFFSDLARSEQYIHLLGHHPELLDPLLTPLLHSPHMAELLRQSPHIIDVFVSPESDLSTDFVFASPDTETRMESLRRFTNEHLYLNYYELMAGAVSEPGLQLRLTRLAEAALRAAVRIVADDLGLDNLPLGIVGLGKLGTRQMMPQSDLDLLFLFPDDVDPDLSSTVVRRLRTVINAPMNEGVVYELDMRLRPSGRSGPPAVTLSAFRDHHQTRARNWEHLALGTARFVCGDAGVGKEAARIIADTLARPRDPLQLRSDCARMWSRIRDQRVRSTPARLFDARLREGGLLQAEFTGNARRLMGLGTEGLGEAETYFSAQLIWQRLLGLEGRAEVSERFRNAVPTGKTGRLAADVEAVTAETFGDVDAGGEDGPVIWL